MLIVRASICVNQAPVAISMESGSHWSRRKLWSSKTADRYITTLTYPSSAEETTELHITGTPSSSSCASSHCPSSPYYCPPSPKAQVVLAMTTLLLSLKMQLLCHPFRDYHAIQVAAPQPANYAPTAGGDLVVHAAASSSASSQFRVVRQQCKSYLNQLETVTLASLCCALVFGLIFYDDMLQKQGFDPDAPLTSDQEAGERMYDAIVIFFHLAVYSTAVVIAYLFMRQMNEQHPYNPVHRFEIRMRDLLGIKRSKERLVLKARTAAPKQLVAGESEAGEASRASWMDAGGESEISMSGDHTGDEDSGSDREESQDSQGISPPDSKAVSRASSPQPLKQDFPSSGSNVISGRNSPVVQGKPTPEVEPSEIRLVTMPTALNASALRGQRRRSLPHNFSLSSAPKPASNVAPPKRLPSIGGSIHRRSGSKFNLSQRDLRVFSPLFPAPTTDLQKVSVWSEYGNEAQRAAAKAAIEKKEAQDALLKNGRPWLVLTRISPLFSGQRPRDDSAVNHPTLPPLAPSRRSTWNPTLTSNRLPGLDALASASRRSSRRGSREPSVVRQNDPSPVPPTASPDVRLGAIAPDAASHARVNELVSSAQEGIVRFKVSSRRGSVDITPIIVPSTSESPNVDGSNDQVRIHLPHQVSSPIYLSTPLLGGRLPPIQGSPNPSPDPSAFQRVLPHRAPLYIHLPADRVPGEIVALDTLHSLPLPISIALDVAASPVDPPKVASQIGPNTSADENRKASLSSPVQFQSGSTTVLNPSTNLSPALLSSNTNTRSTPFASPSRKTPLSMQSPSLSTQLHESSPTDASPNRPALMSPSNVTAGLLSPTRAPGPLPPRIFKMPKLVTTSVPKKATSSTAPSSSASSPVGSIAFAPIMDARTQSPSRSGTFQFAQHSSGIAFDAIPSPSKKGVAAESSSPSPRPQHKRQNTASPVVHSELSPQRGVLPSDLSPLRSPSSHASQSTTGKLRMTRRRSLSPTAASMGMAGTVAPSSNPLVSRALERDLSSGAIHLKPSLARSHSQGGLDTTASSLPASGASIPTRYLSPSNLPRPSPGAGSPGRASPLLSTVTSSPPRLLRPLSASASTTSDGASSSSRKPWLLQRAKSGLGNLTSENMSELASLANAASRRTPELE